MLWPALGNSITPCQNLVLRARSAKGLFKFHKYIYSKNWLRLLDQDKAVTVASRSSWLWLSGGKVLFLSLPPASKHHHPCLVFPHPFMPAVWQKGHGTNQLNCWFIKPDSGNSIYPKQHCLFLMVMPVETVVLLMQQVATHQGVHSEGIK